jgi:maltose O-acetyltransferase
MKLAVYFLYVAVVRFTPEDYRPYALFWPWLRSTMVRYFAQQCGKRPRVKSNADISMKVSIGDFSELGTRCMIQSNVKIGSYVIMGPDVKIYSRNHIFSSLEMPIALQGKERKETRIGDDVWIGANVIVLPGVDIGDHCVIGAGAVVTKSMPAYAIIGGVPARQIGSRCISSNDKAAGDC